jgi:hypothetical protein
MFSTARPHTILDSLDNCQHMCEVFIIPVVPIVELGAAVELAALSRSRIGLASPAAVHARSLLGRFWSVKRPNTANASHRCFAW